MENENTNKKLKIRFRNLSLPLKAVAIMGFIELTFFSIAVLGIILLME